MAPGPNTSLAEMLGRLRASKGRSIELSGAELATWPAGDVAALQAAGLLIRGSPATGIVCPGCEQACAMRVEQVPRAGRPPVLFIVCDKREDIASVMVPPQSLETWRTDEIGLADALARLLGSDAATAFPLTGHRLGTVKGRRGKAVAYLSWQDGAPALMLAGHVVDLLLVADIEADRLVLDLEQLRRYVDAPAGAPVVEEAPAHRQRRLMDLVATERRRNPQKFLQAAADLEGITVYALKQVIYRKAKRAEKPADAIGDMAAALTRPVSKKATRKH